MLPTIAIVGRPNVGKSTLFNCLTKSRAALVADQPGVTRDRIYGEGVFDSQRFMVIDTGGLSGEKNGIQDLTEQQVWFAITEADAILFVVDARVGITAADEIIADRLRRLTKSFKPIYLVVNKIDGLEAGIAVSEFYSLGLADPFPVSAAHCQGTETLLAAVLPHLPQISTEVAPDFGIKIAVVGKPNVGKSTLVNRMLGEERVIVYDQPGTTRDSVYVPFVRREKKYTLIDTAGVRRRRGVTEHVEKISVIKSLQAIEAANVVIMVIDAQEGVTEQDLRLLGFIIDAGKALVIAVNKCDGLGEKRQEVERELDRRLEFVRYAAVYFISALHGTAVGDLFNAIDQAYAAAMKKLSTSELTRILESAVANNQPPSPQGREIKLRYAHAGGHNPPVIVIHGKQVNKLPESYRRYLANFFRSALKLTGTPVQIELRGDKNPYKDSES